MRTVFVGCASGWLVLAAWTGGLEAVVASAIGVTVGAGIGEYLDARRERRRR